ncbi:MAG: bifunctional homocysteine S-methyltransferase/methylenetetrahydrofolate reductase [Lentisphaeria bacterium]
MNNLELRQYFQKNIVIFDGAMGTELYRRHVFTNRCYDELCLSEPELVSEIHRDYLQAGADVILTNTFGANRAALHKFALGSSTQKINAQAVELAKQTIKKYAPNRNILIAGSIGPVLEINAALKPSTAKDILLEQANALVQAGADFLLFETIPKPENAIAALEAMQEMPKNTPFVLSFAIMEEQDHKQIIENDFACLNEFKIQPAALGLNCGLGLDSMLEALKIALKCTDLPLIVQPNAGIPKTVDGRQLYLCSPEYLSTYAVRYVNLGARAVGGCCGTTPEHIRDLALTIKPLSKISTPKTTPKTPKISALKPLPEKELRDKSLLGKKLADGLWIKAIEMAPPRGWDSSKLIEKVKACSKNGIDTLNIPDGPRAAPRLSAMITALKIQQETNIETILHVCCRDRNYIGLQADLLGCAASGIKNLLFITGDPPKLGNYSFATGVFDTDSIGLIKLQKNLNHGIDLGGQQINPPTAAVIGVGADPNAIDFEREIQRLKLKIEAGADYITTQPVFDIKALERMINALGDMRIPIIAGIWPMASLRNALFMKNEVPGVSVPDEIIERISKETTREGQLSVGIAIAREAIKNIRELVQGVQVSAPLGNISAAFRVLE